MKSMKSLLALALLMIVPRLALAQSATHADHCDQVSKLIAADTDRLASIDAKIASSNDQNEKQRLGGQRDELARSLDQQADLFNKFCKNN